MGLNFATLPAIVRGEIRVIRLMFDTPATSTEQSAHYRLGLSTNRSQPDLLTIDFGPSEYIDGGWTVVLTAEQTANLPRNTVYLGVWNADAKQPVCNLISLTIGDQAGRPTS